MNMFKNFLVGILFLLPATQSVADDYKTAQRFSDGDVVSASVLNDILDRIELSLVTPTSADLVGTWNLVQTTTASGCLGNGNSCTPSGYDTAVDGIYKQRSDTVTFANDGDGTFSFQTTNYCAFIQGEGNSSCSYAYAIIDGRMLMSVGGANYAYSLRKVSPTRFVISSYATGSQSFVSIRLDKTGIAPEAPSSLTNSLSSSAISLSWTAPTGATSYDVQRKTTANGTFASVGTSTSASYSDSTVSSGSTYWYRVFAKNSDGTSLGSNVIKVTFNPSASLSSSSIGITDYLNGVASAESEHKIIYSISSNTMTANLGVGKLDAENLNGLLAGSGGKSPVLKFTLANVPSAGMSGTATLTSRILDGSDTTLDSGERSISATANVSWSSDGDKLTLTVPSQSSTVTLTSSNGTAISGTWDISGSSRLMTINSNGINQPASLDVKLLEFLSSNVASSGPSIGNFFSAGNYFYEVGITGIDLTDASDNAFNKVQGSFGVDSNPTSVVYVDDVSVSEGLDLATVLVTLSTSASDAVTLDYATAGSSAISGSDFTATSGSVRIAAGSRRGAFTVPLTNDSTSEGNETFTVSLSNLTNAAFGRSSATVTIVDNDSAS